MNRKNKENTGKNSYIFTRETLGMTLLLFSAIILVMLLTGSSVFAGIGKAVCTFLYGTFGYGSLLLIALTAYLGVWLVFEKHIKISIKTLLAVCLTAFCAFLLFHAATSRNISLSNYGEYIKVCYTSASSGFSGYTFGGVISAIFVYPVAKVTTFVGSYIIFSLFTIASGYLLFMVLRRRVKAVNTEVPVVNGIEEYEEETTTVRPVRMEQAVPQQEVETQKTAEEPASIIHSQSNYRTDAVLQNTAQSTAQSQEDDNPFSQKNLGRKIIFKNGQFDAESYRRNLIFSEDSYFNHPVRNDADYLSSFSSSKSVTANQSYSDSYQEDILNQPAASAPANYVFGDKPVDRLEDLERESGEAYSVQTNKVFDQKDAYAEADYSKTLREDAKSFEEPKTVRNSLLRDTISFGESSVFPDEVKEKVEEKSEPAQITRSDSVPDIERTERTERTLSRSETLRANNDNDDKPDDGSAVDMFKLFSASNSLRGGNRIEPDVSRISSRRTERSKANLFDDDESEEEQNKSEQIKPVSRNLNSESRTERFGLGKVEREVGPAPALDKRDEEHVKISVPTQSEPPKQEEKPKHVWKKYVRPGLELLDDYPESNNVNTGEIEDNKYTIVETLAKFKIDSEVSNVIIGPAVTRYDVVIEDKTKITQALKYKEAIAMALMKDNVTAYLNYSKGALSIEVPNNVRTVVGLKTMLASSKFINCKPNTITFALGKNVEGEVMCPDITKMPHLLVAGTTGSGKSICLSSLIVSLLYKYGPEELRFILVDPKQVEFIPYDKLPHLMINEIISEVDKAVKALNWAIKEMERRYSLFKEMTEQGKLTKTLDEYNAHLPEGEEKLPKIVIILDEFGDLMLQAKKDIEGKIIKLVQKARACGIHLILATQRPSVDCITGLIKSNLPTRIGFKVNSFDDARTIFDIGGAEKLLGKGDMYLRSAESAELARIQGCFVDSHEVQKVTDFVKEHNETYFDQSVSDFINTVEVEESSGNAMSEEGGADGGDMKIDETHIKALYYCVCSNQASVSMIQRRFPVGYIKACKIIDWMENMNYVSQSEGSKPRKVLLTKDEFIKIYGEIDD